MKSSIITIFFTSIKSIIFYICRNNVILICSALMIWKFYFFAFRRLHKDFIICAITSVSNNAIGFFAAKLIAMKRIVIKKFRITHPAYTFHFQVFHRLFFSLLDIVFYLNRLSNNFTWSISPLICRLAKVCWNGKSNFYNRKRHIMICYVIIGKQH